MEVKLGHVDFFFKLSFIRAQYKNMGKGVVCRDMATALRNPCP